MLLFIGITLLTCCVGIDAVVPDINLNDGNSMPGFALGTGRGTKREGESLEAVRHAVRWALKYGYRHVDTASIYGDEKEVGEGIADAIGDGAVKREDVFVTTKLWNDDHHKKQVVPALRKSLERLGLEYVDLYLIHFPTAFTSDGEISDADYLETWKGMEEAKKLGLTRSIGVSNFNQQQLERLIANAEIKPSVNQIEVNPTLTQYPLVEYAKKNNIAVMAYSPLGFMVSRKSQEAPPPHMNDQLLTSMANKYRKSTPQIVLRYLVDRGLTPISKSTDQSRIKQNIDIFDFKLTDQEVAEINKFNKDKRVINPVDWKDHPYYPFERSNIKKMD